MALTYTTTKTNYVGDQKIVYGTVTFDSSYPTGGESFDETQIGLHRLDFLTLNQGEDGFVFHWDKANEKVMAFGQEPTNATAGVIGLSQVAAATDLSNAVIEFQAFGV